jgi:hypothetical protein
VIGGAWGYALRAAPTGGDIQDAGVHFGVSVVPW